MVQPLDLLIPFFPTMFVIYVTFVLYFEIQKESYMCTMGCLIVWTKWVHISYLTSSIHMFKDCRGNFE